MITYTELEKIDEMCDKAEGYLLDEQELDSLSKFAESCREASASLTDFSTSVRSIPEPNPQLQAIIAWREKNLR